MSASEKKIQDRKLCFVPGCGSRSYNNLNIGFHTFPKPGVREVTIHNAYGKREKVDLCYAWKKVLRMQYELPNHAKVCSRHFVKDDYFTAGHHKLKRNAVPSTNLPFSSVSVRQVNNSLCEARKERLLNRKKQKLALINKGLSSSENITHNKDIEASGDVDEAEESNLSVEESHKEPSGVEIGVQVKTGFLTFGIVEFIKTDSDLKCATGLESMNHLDMIVKEIDNAIKGKGLKIHSRIGIRKQIILTLIKLKHNLNYTFLRLLFQSYSAYHCRNMFVEMLGILGTLNFVEQSYSLQRTLDMLLLQPYNTDQVSNDEI